MKSVIFDKLVNLHDNWGPWLKQAQGEFVAIVRLVDPAYCPRKMTVLGKFGKMEVKARFAAEDLPQITEDGNILSLELREHIGGLETA